MSAAGGLRPEYRSGTGRAARRAVARQRARRRVRGAARALLPAAVLLTVAGCEQAPDSISRQEFVNTYVALRTAELRGNSAVITARARDSVLAARGVSEEDLVTFADVHGDDPVYMAELWGEVADSLEQYTGRPDTAR